MGNGSTITELILFILIWNFNVCDPRINCFQIISIQLTFKMCLYMYIAVNIETAVCVFPKYLFIHHLKYQPCPNCIQTKAVQAIEIRFCIRSSEVLLLIIMFPGN